MVNLIKTINSSTDLQPLYSGHIAIVFFIRKRKMIIRARRTTNSWLTKVKDGRRPVLISLSLFLFNNLCYIDKTSSPMVMRKVDEKERNILRRVFFSPTPASIIRHWPIPSPIEFVRQLKGTWEIGSRDVRQARRSINIQCLVVSA